MNIKTQPNITDPFIVIFLLSYHGKLVIYVHKKASYTQNTHWPKYTQNILYQNILLNTVGYVLSPSYLDRHMTQECCFSC